MNKFRLVIGDIHGKGKFVKEVYDKILPDEVILLGDYADGARKTATEIKQSWDIIVDLQKFHNEKYHNKSFITLMGNHDLQYILRGEEYSGKNYQTEQLMGPEYRIAIDENRLPIVFIDYINKIIYSHAGVTNTWLDGEWIENINKLSLKYFRFTYGDTYNIYGDDPKNGPLWVRIPSLVKDPYKDKDGYVWKQIFGHTNVKVPFGIEENGVKENKYYSEDDPKVVEAKFICMDNFPDYYMIQTIDEDGKITKTEIIKRAIDISHVIPD